MGEVIFVFGSNLAGRHGRGSAKHAREVYCAEYGVGVGRTGMAYAIPTKGHKLEVLSLKSIKYYIEEFISYAYAKPNLHFDVVKIGCGLAGYSEEEIKPMFSQCRRLDNVTLPRGW